VAQKYKIAIIGAGPSGYFAAQALQNSVTEDLTNRYDAVVMATGSAIGNHMVISN
jgi:2-polyprenyl-6-methoxyphenol hydroxylase-like FAD-dependent oxidoreductase